MRESTLEDDVISYVVERDVDLAFVQLVHTSEEFRDWFVDRVDVDDSVDEFHGVRHSITTDTGESDVEIGVGFSSGDDHIVLVENKINASMQERQAERYFERGENYVQRGEWDGFTVCLIAPEEYVNDGERRAFESVVTYEQIIAEIETLSHDGREFLVELFRLSLAKSIPADHSELTGAVAEGVLAVLQGVADVDVYQRSNTHVRLASTHQEHPPFVLYNAYIPGSHDGEKAIVRINLTGRDGVPDVDLEALQTTLRKHRPDGFDVTDRPMDIVRTEVLREDFASREEYVDHVVGTLADLVEFYHPLLVGAVDFD